MLRFVGFMLVLVLLVCTFGCGDSPRPLAQNPEVPQTLPIPPQVEISSISPMAAATGSPRLKLTVAGTNFTSLSTVIWSADGTDTDLRTTFVNSGELTAVVPARLLSKPVDAKISVQFFDPFTDSGTGRTQPVTFSVSDTGAPSADSTITLSGNWTGRFVADMGAGHSVDAKIQGPLVESSGSIKQTGLALKSSTCFSAVLVRSGTRNGSTVKMSMMAADFASIQFSGTLSGSKLSGTFRIDGSECGSGTGTLTMTRIPPVTGTWGGTLRNSATGIQAPIALSLTQTSTILSTTTTSAPFSISSLKVTGVLRQAGSGCTLQILSQTPGFLGSIQGTALKEKSNGTPALTLRGSVNVSSTSFSGTYRISGTSCDGQTGTFSLNRQ